MAVRLYNPRTRSFVAAGVPDTDLSLSDLIAFNILIELQALNTQLSGQAPNTDDLDLIKKYLVQEN